MIRTNNWTAVYSLVRVREHRIEVRKESDNDGELHNLSNKMPSIDVWFHFFFIQFIKCEFIKEDCAIERRGRDACGSSCFFCKQLNTSKKNYQQHRTIESKFLYCEKNHFESFLKKAIVYDVSMSILLFRFHLELVHWFIESGWWIVT